MTEPVNFELAKLLKGKGLNDFTKKWYSVEGSCYDEDAFDYHFGAVPSQESFAPTIAEVVMWLYKKRGIWVYVDTSSARKWVYFINLVDKDNYLASDDAECGELYFNSPIEAYEGAISYALNNFV